MVRWCSHRADGRQYGHAEFGGQARHIYVYATFLRDVHAIESQHHRQTETFHFEREPQPDGHVHGVHDAHHELGRRCVGHATQQHVASDGFIERGRAQAVRAGQVEDSQHPPVQRDAFALAPFHGHAWVVSNLLAAAGQAVEKRGLAAVGHADQRDSQRRG
jgi:hypothetical protein